MWYVPVSQAAAVRPLMGQGRPNIPESSTAPGSMCGESTFAKQDHGNSKICLIKKKMIRSSIK